MYIFECFSIAQVTRACAKTAWGKRARVVLPLVPRSARRVTPGSQSITREPSVFVFVRVLDCALFVGGQETFTIITLRTFMHFDLAVKVCTCHNGAPKAEA